jgi:LmbE family N-acetylglucosaminyl deacetylase
MNLTKYKNETVMIVVPHPDDMESGAGGTISYLTAQGTRVVLMVLTDGSKGCTPHSHGATPCEGITPPQIAAMRAVETRAAAASLGVAKVIMLTGYPDGFLYAAQESQVRQTIAQHMRAEKPFMVMTFRPFPDLSVPNWMDTAGNDGTAEPGWGGLWGDLGFHSDHMDTGRHVLNVVRGALGNLFTFEGSGEPWSTSEFYFWDWSGQGTHYVELNDAATEAKLVAWAHHKSQYSEEAALRARWKQVGLQVGERLGLPKGTSAEGFVRF